MIRFIKNIKAISQHDIKLTSFDINAICYDIDMSKYSHLPFYGLVPVIYNQLYSLCNDAAHANSLVSVDGREPIFRGSPEKLANMKYVLDEIGSVLVDLKKVEIYG